MAHSIQLSSAFDVSTITFSKLMKSKKGNKSVYLSGSNGSKVHIQLPYMRAPFGLSTFTDEKSGSQSFSLDLALDENDANPDVLDFKNKIEKLDEMVLTNASKNSKEWFGQDYDAAGLKKYNLFKPMARPGKDQYADKKTFKLKILQDSKTGEFVPESYNHKRELVSMTSIEKSQKVMCIIELSSIWIIDGKFGVTARLLQCLLEPSKKLPSFAFQLPPASSEEEIEYEDVEEEVDDSN